MSLDLSRIVPLLALVPAGRLTINGFDVSGDVRGALADGKIDENDLDELAHAAIGILSARISRARTTISAPLPPAPVVPAPVVVAPPPPVVVAPAGAIAITLGVPQVYHDWHKKLHPENPENTAATPDKIAAYLSGREAMPGESHIHFNVGIAPEGTPRNQIPETLTLHLVVNGPGKTGHDTFTPATGQAPVEGANGLGKVPPGMFTKSDGYHGILVTYEFGGGGPSDVTLWADGVSQSGAYLSTPPVKFTMTHGGKA